MPDMLLANAPVLAARMSPWQPVRQSFDDNAVTNPMTVLGDGIRNSASLAALAPGARVALAVGSRGIARLPELVTTAVKALEDLGLNPFIVPAMGSHGGATADGQSKVLAALGVTPDSIGAPIRATMDTAVLGRVNGLDVHCDAIAVREADAIIPLARVKAHTDFEGPIQSGLLKMISIGLGKAAGADEMHRVDSDRMSGSIEAVGRYLLQRLPVPCGIAVVEDAYDHLGIVEVVEASRIPDREPELLSASLSWLPRLPFDAVDILVVKAIGKNIAGTGMDPNVTGRFYRPRQQVALRARYVVVLRLTAETHGNATGIGMADIVTRRVADAVDWHSTYVNEITARMLPGGKLPIVASDDREAIGIALHALGMTAPEDATVAYIDNTRDLTTFYASLPLWEQINTNHRLAADGPAVPVRFSATGDVELPRDRRP
jgi:hypothetical protein